MKIKQASLLTGVGEHMIRYYESLGIIKPDRNPVNNYREYTVQNLSDIVTIKQYNELGIPLKVIAKMIHSGKTDEALIELDSAIDHLKNMIEWSQIRLSNALYFQNIFQMIQNNTSSATAVFSERYYYSRDSISDSVYKKLYIDGGVRPVFRICRENLTLPVYPNDQGMLSLKRINKYHLSYSTVPEHLCWRTIRKVKSEAIMNYEELKPVLKQMEDEGYMLDGDIFLSEIIGSVEDNHHITILIECDVKPCR